MTGLLLPYANRPEGPAVQMLAVIAGIGVKMDSLKTALVVGATILVIAEDGEDVAEAAKAASSWINPVFLRPPCEFHAGFHDSTKRLGHARRAGRRDCLKGLDSEEGLRPLGNRLVDHPRGRHVSGRLP